MEESNIVLQNGPDQVLPSNDYVTIKQDGCVKLRIPETGLAIETLTPKSVPTFFRDTVDRFPNNYAYAYKSGNAWIKVTYREYFNQVNTCAKAFLHLGLERLKSVCILGFNSPEWFISYLGAIFAGGIGVGIYTTNSPEACHYCASTSQANIIVVQDEYQLKKILEIRDQLPHLKTIVQYEGEPNVPDVLNWKKLMQIGREQTDEKLQEALQKIAINQCCSIVYTSGTVGDPKGVLLSHDNLTWNVVAAQELLRVNMGAETVISYLPLSHVAAQVTDIFIVIHVAGTTYFADQNALKGSIINTMLEVKPTRFLAVPRIWEKMFEKLTAIGAANGQIKKTIATWAKKQALQHHSDRQNGENSTSLGYKIASSLVLKKVKQALGLGNALECYSVAAPLSSEIKKYFISLDLPIQEVFGMSELTGPYTVTPKHCFNLKSIGFTVPGSKTTIHNPENGEGELCMTGRNVFMGYLNDQEKTEAAIERNGVFHSGDLGCIDAKGLVYITGRLKELIITAGGENIPPVQIENTLKLNLPHISNAFLVGDQKKFLSILLTFKTKIDNTTNQSLDELEPETQKWLDSLGCGARTVSEILANGLHPNLQKALQHGIDKTNQVATSNAQKIQKFTVLSQDFSIPTGEIGPTMKVKRSVVAKKYAQIIDEMYK